MEDDFDIYDDLPLFGSENNDEASDNDDVKTIKYQELTNKINDLTTQTENLQRINKNLETNMASLLKTAKCEIARKDRMIDELRKQLDNIAFRRCPPKPNIKIPNYNSKTDLNYNCHKTQKKQENTYHADTLNRSFISSESSLMTAEEDREEEDINKVQHPLNYSTVYGERLRKKIQLAEDEERKLYAKNFENKEISKEQITTENDKENNISVSDKCKNSDTRTVPRMNEDTVKNENKTGSSMRPTLKRVHSDDYYEFESKTLKRDVRESSANNNASCEKYISLQSDIKVNYTSHSKDKNSFRNYEKLTHNSKFTNHQNEINSEAKISYKHEHDSYSTNSYYSKSSWEENQKSISRLNSNNKEKYRYNNERIRDYKYKSNSYRSRSRSREKESDYSNGYYRKRSPDHIYDKYHKYIDEKYKKQLKISKAVSDSKSHHSHNRDLHDSKNDLRSKIYNKRQHNNLYRKNNNFNDDKKIKEKTQHNTDFNNVSKNNKVVEHSQSINEKDKISGKSSTIIRPTEKEIVNISNKIKENSSNNCDQLENSKKSDDVKQNEVELTNISNKINEKSVTLSDQAKDSELEEGEVLDSPITNCSISQTRNDVITGLQSKDIKCNTVEIEEKQNSSSSSFTNTVNKVPQNEETIQQTINNDKNESTVENKKYNINNIVKQPINTAKQKNIEENKNIRNIKEFIKTHDRNVEKDNKIQLCDDDLNVIKNVMNVIMNKIENNNACRSEKDDNKKPNSALVKSANIIPKAIGSRSTQKNEINAPIILARRRKPVQLGNSNAAMTVVIKPKLSDVIKNNHETR